MSKPLIAVAGSTDKTTFIAETLTQSSDLSVCWVLTPAPKSRGRNTKPTPNPLHQFADSNDIEVILVEKNLNQARAAITAAAQPDILLVVDFGYLIPDWLLELPKVAPVNIHPSRLPRWRGSSPAQFALLFGDKHSAVTLIELTADLDQGPIIAQLPFTTRPSWTQSEYYQHSFQLIANELATILSKYIDGKCLAQPQPKHSPTPIARRLSRDDGFVEWSLLTHLLVGSDTELPSNPELRNQLLQEAADNHSSLAVLLEQACRALSPWPGLWTTVPTKKGNSRMKILQCSVAGSKKQATAKLQLDTVQLAGKNPAPWQQVKANLEL